jgi:hypothetical protein
MTRIKCLYLGVAVWTQWDTVLEGIRTSIGLLFDVMADKPSVLKFVTKTACALACHERI